MTTNSPEDVLAFWFPERPPLDPPAVARRMEWWFRGGVDAQIMDRFAQLPDKAERGELEEWTMEARARLALILVLDQFSRTVFRGTARAYAQDPLARALSLEGIRRGHYSQLDDPWEKTFFILPLGHSERVADLDVAVEMAEELARRASYPHRDMLEFSASQARAHRDVVARFGRQPHRNGILGRDSTAEELMYLAEGKFVHLREPSR